MENQSTRTAVIFSVDEEIGALAKALHIFQKYGINLQYIQSRFIQQNIGDPEFYIECNYDRDSLNNVIEELDHKSKYLQVENIVNEPVPWFPRKIRELDQLTDHIVPYEFELDVNHPGFHDPIYRKHREECVNIAKQYRHNQPIPRIIYTSEEIATWRILFRQLTNLYPTHACKEVNRILPLLIDNCGYNENNIPQLEDVSQFLQDCTGFRLRPVAGLLSSRDFLAALAFRVFYSTQYIRHHSMPMYTPEPDICHELLGHVPLLADPDFAEFCQEIGLASLGASDETIASLATLYWFTIEFGLCVENDEQRAYGAGLLSSVGELQYCLTDKPTIMSFDPFRAAIQPYPITEHQPTYFLTENFKDAKEKLRQFTMITPRSFTVHYNPFTQSVEVINNKKQILDFIRTSRNNLDMVFDILRKTGMTSN